MREAGPTGKFPGSGRGKDGALPDDPHRFRCLVGVARKPA